MGQFDTLFGDNNPQLQQPMQKPQQQKQNAQQQEQQSILADHVRQISGHSKEIQTEPVQDMQGQVLQEPSYGLGIEDLLNDSLATAIKSDDFTVELNRYKKSLPYAKQEYLSAVDQSLLDEYGINTPERRRHFFAQLAHESDGFQTTEGYASGKAYEGRGDLGNTMPGDGVKYKERGFIQLAGKYNYNKYGERLGIDLINNPELAADPKVAWRLAAEFWKENNLNQLADDNNILAITKRINGGVNGLDDRRRYYNAFGQ